MSSLLQRRSLINNTDNRNVFKGRIFLNNNWREIWNSNEATAQLPYLCFPILPPMNEEKFNEIQSSINFENYEEEILQYCVLVKVDANGYFEYVPTSNNYEYAVLLAQFLYSACSSGLAYDVRIDSIFDLPINTLMINGKEIFDAYIQKYNGISMFNTHYGSYASFNGQKNDLYINLPIFEANQLFYTFQGVKKLTLDIDLSQCNGFTEMFYESDIDEIDLSKVIWPTSGLNMQTMFYDCQAEKIIFDSNIELNFDDYGSSRMFHMCQNLATLILPKGNARQLDYMFSSCTLLEELDLSTFIDGGDYQLISMIHTFNNCSNLKKIIFPPINGISLENAPLDTFYGCENLVEMHVSSSLKDFFINNKEVMQLPTRFHDEKYEGWVVYR